MDDNFGLEIFVLIITAIPATIFPTRRSMRQPFLKRSIKQNTEIIAPQADISFLIN